MRYSICLLFCLLSLSRLNAQADTNQVSYERDTIQRGEIQLNADDRIEKLLEIKKANSIKSPSLPGYRIQLFYGPRTEALEYQAEFLKLFPEIDCYLIYDAPNFKVRIGDFRDKYAARRMHLGLLESFPDSFILADQIDLPELPKFD